MPKPKLNFQTSGNGGPGKSTATAVAIECNIELNNNFFVVDCDEQTPTSLARRYEDALKAYDKGRGMTGVTVVKISDDSATWSDELNKLLELVVYPHVIVNFPANNEPQLHLLLKHTPLMELFDIRFFYVLDHTRESLDPFYASLMRNQEEYQGQIEHICVKNHRVFGAWGKSPCSQAVTNLQEEYGFPIIEIPHLLDREALEGTAKCPPTSLGEYRDSFPSTGGNPGFGKYVIMNKFLNTTFEAFKPFYIPDMEPEFIYQEED